MENQDGLLADVTENDILQYIQYIVEDEQQFATLTAPKAIEKMKADKYPSFSIDK